MLFLDLLLELVITRVLGHYRAVLVGDLALKLFDRELELLILSEQIIRPLGDPVELDLQRVVLNFGLRKQFLQRALLVSNRRSSFAQTETV